MRALICGISGQDGAFLAELLLNKDYEVWGTSRDSQTNDFRNLAKLGIKDRINLCSMAPNDFRSVFTTLERCEPDEVYFLSGQSSVGLSFDQPAETLDSIVTGTLNMLEVIRLRHRQVRYYNAGSSECFGDTYSHPADENTAFRPRSPYAVAKASAHWLVANYRNSYGLHANTGILFNHESYLRPSRFVTQKIIQGAKKIANGELKRLELGQLSIQRDWGWAPEYVQAMWAMLQQSTPADYVIATGKTHSLADFVDKAFRLHGLDWRDYVDINEKFFRPDEILVSSASPTLAFKKLGWKASLGIDEIILRMSKELL